MGFNNTQPLQLSNLDSEGMIMQKTQQKPSLTSATPKQQAYPQDIQLFDAVQNGFNKTHRGVVFNNFFTTESDQPRGMSSKMARSNANLPICSKMEGSPESESQHSPDFKSNIIKEGRSKQHVNGNSIQNRMHRI